MRDSGTGTGLVLRLMEAAAAEQTPALSPLKEEVTALFDELRFPLLRYLLCLGLSMQSGEDIIQEAFLALFLHLKSGKPRHNLRGWVFRVGHNLALKQRRRETAPGTAPDHPDPSPNPEDRVAVGQQRRRVLAVLQALPRQDQSCLALRAEGLRYREIAEVLGISLGAVALSLDAPSTVSNGCTTSMRTKDTHLSDHELLLEADGELASNRARHLASCELCRQRRRHFQTAFDEYARHAHPRALGHDDNARNRFRAALDNLPSRQPDFTAWRHLAYLAAAFASVVFSGFWIESHLITGKSAPTPNSSLTPGLVQTGAPVCSGSLTEPLPVSLATANQVFEQYGIHNPPPGAYEVDYLITPALGGATDLRNLWPQPYSPEWNARVKDALEDHLQRLVCEGRLDIAVAQRDLAADWIAAYRKYFRTNRPLVVHQAFLKDRPWQ